MNEAWHETSAGELCRLLYACTFLRSAAQERKRPYQVQPRALVESSDRPPGSFARLRGER